MANEEHLKILKQGVDVWNPWRVANPGIYLDLSKADLSGADLSEANLDGAYVNKPDFDGAIPVAPDIGPDIGRVPLYKVDLEGADLRGARLEEAKLRAVNLRGARLEEANLEGAKLRKACLEEANLIGANLKMADLYDASLVGADLSRADLNEANLYGVNLYRANLSEAHLWEANLSEANLGEAGLYRADLKGANLSHADLQEAGIWEATLSEANLSEASLCRADLIGANLDGADLRWADLGYANLYRANLYRANLSGAYLSGADLTESRLAHTIFGNVVLADVKGLDSVYHRGPSTIGIDTIYKSRGKIPEAFLRGAGVPEVFIAHIPHLITDEAIQFFPCFIIYSTKDQDFAERLHNDLQSKGVRCWFAPQDIKGVRKLHDPIRDGFWLNYKLLLVLSESSMNSEWVKAEIYHASQDEISNNKRKLFPISLVGYSEIRDWTATYASRDIAVKIQEHFIHDFSNWKDHDAYKKAFDRLMRELNLDAEE